MEDLERVNCSWNATEIFWTSRGEKFVVVTGKESHRVSVGNLAK